MDQAEYEERFRRFSPRLRELTEWIVLHWDDWNVIIGATEAGLEACQAVLAALMKTPFEELQAVMRYRIEYLNRRNQGGGENPFPAAGPPPSR